MDTSARAADKVRHLALVRPAPTKIKVAAYNQAAAEPVQSSPVLTQLPVKSQPAAAGAEARPKPDVTVNSPMEAPVLPGQPDPLVLARENLHANRSVVVAAGYGRLWNDECMLHYIAPARQEPGCAYLKASINF